MAQIREEVSFTKGRIIVRGKLVSRGKGKRSDYILYYKPNILATSLATGEDTRRRLLDALLYEALKETLEPFKEHQRCVV